MQENIYRLMQEADKVRETEYWKAIILRIQTIRELAVKQLILDPIEKHSNLQGQIWAIDRVLELPEKVISDLKAKG